MKAFLGMLEDCIWAAFFDDNDWWIKGLHREDAYYAQPGVVRH